MSSSKCPLFSPLGQVANVLTFVAQYKAPLEVVPPQASIAEAWQILAHNEVLSAPLQKEGGGYHGLIDMFDVVSFLIGQCVESAHTEGEQKFGEQVSWRGWCCDRSQLTTHGGDLISSIPAIVIVNHSGLNPFVTLSLNAHVSELLAALKGGTHRVMVLDDQGKAECIISQWDVLRLIEQCIGSSCPDLGSKTLAELGLDKPSGGKLVTISGKERALYAFHQMLEHKVSAIAVVDDSGMIQGNISVSDLRGLGAADLGSLLQPVTRFIREKSHQITPVMCSGSTSFATALHRLVHHGLHRLWCTDAELRPVAAVALTDVLRIIDKHSLLLQEQHLHTTETTIT